MVQSVQTLLLQTVENQDNNIHCNGILVVG